MGIVPFRVAENNLAYYKKYGGRRRASDSFRASVCQQAKTERKHADK
jgi:hypothetical protein